MAAISLKAAANTYSGVTGSVGLSKSLGCGEVTASLITGSLGVTIEGYAPAASSGASGSTSAQATMVRFTRKINSHTQVRILSR